VTSVVVYTAVSFALVERWCQPFFLAAGCHLMRVTPNPLKSQFMIIAVVIAESKGGSYSLGQNGLQRKTKTSFLLDPFR
jgi:hypothetical protein